MMRRGIAPATLVIAVVVVGWLVTGVSALDVIRFVAYDIGFVALPGAALLWAVRGRRSSFLVSLALGWPLGQALEILAFSGTAAIGIRGLFWLYPVLVMVLCAIPIWRRRHDVERSPGEWGMPVMAMWAAAVALVVGLIYLTIMFLPDAPLPTSTVLTEYPDFPYFLGLIAQARYHWPPTSPGLYSVALPYEWFVFFHMAAAAQITHVPISTIALRLDYLPTVLVVGCQLLAVGRLVSKSAWTGVIAIVVILLLGPLDLIVNANGSPFGDNVLVHFWDSWTYPFGLMFFLAILYLITEQTRVETWRTRTDLRSWALIALLMIGASGAKATVLPVIIVGTGIYAVLHLLVRRSLPAAAVMIVGIGIVIFVATYLVVYAGGAPDTGLKLLTWLSGTPAVVYANTIHHAWIRDIALPFAYAAGLAGVWLPLAGGLYLIRRRHRHEIPSFALPLSMLIAGALITSVVHQIAYSELYFEDMGFVAGAIVAAEGLRLAWRDVGGSLPVSRQAAVVALAVWVVLLIAVVKIASRSIETPATNMRVYVGFAAAGVLFVIAWAMALLARKRSASGSLALALIPLLAAAVLTAPVTIYPSVRKFIAGTPITPTQPVLVPGVLTALHWLREHAPIDAVVAVNNHWFDPGHTNGKYYFYTAFSERQIFIEAYDPIRYGVTPGTPSAIASTFEYRQRVNDAVFTEADASALRIMTAQYSVRYLFIDRRLGSQNPAVLHLGRVVFSNQDAAIVAVG